MKITDISEQKSKGRLNIYIDGDFYAGVSEETAANLGLYVGKEVTEKDLSCHEELDEYYKALSRAFTYLSIRKHSTLELKTKLQRYYSWSTINIVVKRLIDIKYLDDADFAETYVRCRQGFCGPRKLEVDLKKKGLCKEDISMALTSQSEQDMNEAIVRLILKKDKPELDLQKRRERMIRYLAARGFNYPNIKSAISEYIKE